MSTLGLLIVCFSGLALASILVEPFKRHREAELYDDLEPGTDVAVYIEGDQIVKGEVVDVCQGRLALRDAELITAGGQPTPMGRVKIPSRSPILVQEVDPPRVRAIQSKGAANG